MRRAPWSRLLLLSLVLVSVGCGAGARGLDVLASTERRLDRPLRLRVHVSGKYAAQALGTHAHLREIVRDADRIFSSNIGAHVVIEEIVDGWKVDVGRSDDALKALMESDPGGDVDLVVGMLGAASERQDSCVGEAELGGNHMVVRSEDTGRANEHAAAVVVFLHELGHALGASHDDKPGSIMNAAVLSSSGSFSGNAVQIIRDGLERRGIATTSLDPQTRLAAPSGGRATTEVASGDRATFEQALDAERRGDAVAAWSAAEPLFVAYPSVIGVQDLRCRLAQARDLAWSEVRAECRALMRLMMSGANPHE